jgi:acetolactate synthase-1/2/3 large subunit
VLSNRTVAEVVAAELADSGVDKVFGLPGGEILFFMDALRQRGIDFVLCRHEANAGIMAAVYGKLKRTVGVVLTTLGPGAANLMLPIANSLLDREPLLAISAQIPTSFHKMRTHQLLPLLASFRPMTKFTGELNSFNAQDVLRRAISATLDEPRGPAFLTLSAEDAISAIVSSSVRAGKVGLGQSFSPAEADHAADEVRQALTAAERPIVVVGLGTDPQVSSLLRRWLHRWHLPVAVTPKVKGIVDETDPNFVGVVGGMAMDSAMVAALQQSDLIVGIGLDPAEIDGSWHTELPVLWVLESPWATGLVPWRRLIATSHSGLFERLDGDPPRRWHDPFEEFRRSRSAIYGAPPNGQNTVHPVAVVRALATAMPADTIVTTDVGTHKYLLGQFWPSSHPETFFMSNGLSGMGYGIPAAIGAKLARPQSHVLAVVGDGGFSMNSQELETSVRVNAPIITVVLVDHCYSLIAVGQQNRKLPRYGVDFGPIDTVATAAACGVEAVRVSSEAQLAEVVIRALTTGKGLVVEVPIDAGSYHSLM